MARPQAGSPNPGAKRALPSNLWARQDFNTQTFNSGLTQLEPPPFQSEGCQVLHEHVKCQQLCFRYDIQAGQAQPDIDQWFFHSNYQIIAWCAKCFWYACGNYRCKSGPRFECEMYVWHVSSLCRQQPDPCPVRLGCASSLCWYAVCHFLKRTCPA